MARLDLAEWNQIYWKFNTAETVYRTVNGQKKIGGAKKYLNLKHFLPFNIKRYHSLSLPTRSLAIADLGCGAGYFAYYAILQGHFVMVLDRETSSDHFDSQGQEAFDMMTDFFRLPKVTVSGGQTTATFTIATQQVQTATQVVITATEDGLSQQATLTVTP